MEEDIEIIKLIMNETYSNMVNIDGKRIYKLSDRKRQAIENLIKGYKELDKENTRQHELLGKIHEKYQKDYIPKSKVREKIDKLGTYREKHFYFRKDLSKAQHDKSMKMLGAINVLEELLQKGDDK